MNTDITNFINSLCYSVQFDGIPLDEITLDFCKYDLEEMKNHCDPDDIEMLNQITPEMLRDEYVRIWKERNGGKAMTDYTIENIYGILLSCQMLASDIEQCVRENPESITLLSGIAESALEQAKISISILRDIYDDEKTAAFTESVTSRLETIINEQKEE